MARRSRVRRESRGKRLVLTERDLEIFRLLERYRYLNSEYLHAFVGGRSEKRFKERLGDLFHEGYINRPQRQWDFAESRHNAAIYESGERGRAILQSQQTDLTAPLTFLSKARHSQFQHSTMVCHILAALELGGRRANSLHLIGWTEILSKAPPIARRSRAPFAFSGPLKGGGKLNGGWSTSVMPDAVFGIRYTSGDTRKYRFFVLEADRSTMPVHRANLGASSYRKKLAAYDWLLSRRLFKSAWGLPNLLVLTVSPTERHLQTIVDCATAMRQGPSPFLFKPMGDKVLAHPSRAIPALATPWVASDGRFVDLSTPNS